MKQLSIAVALSALACLSACANQSPAPAGWQPVPGASAAWTSGPQQYSYTKTPFPGTLQDLASQEAVNVVLRRRDAKFEKSDTFAACPGQAALATFRLTGSKVLQEAFAVQDGQAIVVTYVRPDTTPADAAASSAMERMLCST